MNERGFTTVPNMSYHRNNKFVYGVVLSINDIDYYVPFSHYDKKQKDNLQVMIKNHGKYEVAGSLRFNYMIPVPKACLKLVDFSGFDEHRKILLQKEYKACLGMLARIQKTAKKTYNRVIAGEDQLLVNNSCLFLKLEEACKKYKGND